MKPALAILISATTAILVSLITAASVRRDTGVPTNAPASDPLRPQVEQLKADVRALRAEIDALKTERPVGIATSVSSKPEPAPPPASTPKSAAAPKQGPSLEQIWTALRQGLSSEAAQKLFEEARKGKSIDALIGSLEAIVEENPENAPAHCLLARACIDALMAEPDFTKKGDWAQKADQEYAKAIEADPALWDAVYGRAVSLSWWPEQLGRMPDAIHGFERALELQAGSSAQPRYADTYAQLARLYTKSSLNDKATAVLAEGLRVFPGNAELRKQLDLLQNR
jgi:tetratricopeptide (TPR) repeat protein